MAQERGLRKNLISRPQEESEVHTNPGISTSGLLASCLLPRKAWARETSSFASSLCSLRKRGMLPSCHRGWLCAGCPGAPRRVMSSLWSPGGTLRVSWWRGWGVAGASSLHPETSSETRGLAGRDGPSGCQWLGSPV